MKCAHTHTTHQGTKGGKVKLPCFILLFFCSFFPSRHLHVGSSFVMRLSFSCTCFYHYSYFLTHTCSDLMILDESSSSPSGLIKLAFDSPEFLVHSSLSHAYKGVCMAINVLFLSKAPGTHAFTSPSRPDL